MYRLAALLLIAGCSFEHGQVAASDAASPDAIDAPLPASCLDGWCRRKAVTIHGNEVAGTSHPDFILLVRATVDAELAASATGPDIRFTTAAGVPLAYERERYVAATGELIAWVHLPALAPVDTTIYLYYGKAGAPEQQDRAMTWPGRYAGIWHLDQTSGTTLGDASGNGNAAVPTNGPMLGVAGAIGNAVRFDGVDDYLLVAQSASLSATTGDATFSLWINWDSLTSSHYQRVLASSNRFTGSGDGYEWSTQGPGPFYMYPWGGAEDYNLGDNPFTAGTWQYLVATLDFATHDLEIYVDGVPMTFTTQNATAALWTSAGAPGDWLWGSNITLTGPFAGMMDEIQVSRGSRPAAWVQTTFANQRPGSTMVTIGAEQMLQ